MTCRSFLDVLSIDENFMIIVSRESKDNLIMKESFDQYKRNCYNLPIEFLRMIYPWINLHLKRALLKKDKNELKLFI